MTVSPKEPGKELQVLFKLSGSEVSNEKFVSRAPEAVVNAEKEKAQKARDLIASLEQSEAALKVCKMDKTRRKWAGAMNSQQAQWDIRCTCFYSPPLSSPAGRGG